MGWIWLSTAASRPSEIAPDRRKPLIAGLACSWWNDFRAERSARAVQLTAMNELAWTTECYTPIEGSNYGKA